MRHVFNATESNHAGHFKRHAAPQNSSYRAAEAIQDIEARWAQVLQCHFDRTRDALLCRLAEQTQELAHRHPNDAKVLLWNGIVLTGYAKSLGGLCALQLQAQAKNSLERAIKLAPRDGAAYLFLSLLYEHSPTSPFSFGDESMAKALLEKGLKLTTNVTKNPETVSPFLIFDSFR